jgi:hypothetical protein
VFVSRRSSTGLGEQRRTAVARKRARCTMPAQRRAAARLCDCVHKRPGAAVVLVITNARRIPRPTVRRLAALLPGLLETRRPGVGHGLLGALAELAGVNAAKVRKDLSYLGSYGTRGRRLRRRLPRPRSPRARAHPGLAGRHRRLGNLGQALANYRGFGAGLPRRGARRRRPRRSARGRRPAIELDSTTSTIVAERGSPSASSPRRAAAPGGRDRLVAPASARS